MIAKHIIVHGIVQGVGYRYNTLLSAQENNIYGWVQNKKDGTVEIMAIGEIGDIQAFMELCNRGPSQARVDKMDVTLAEMNTFTSFKIVR